MLRIKNLIINYERRLLGIMKEIKKMNAPGVYTNLKGYQQRKNVP